MLFMKKTRHGSKNKKLYTPFELNSMQNDEITSDERVYYCHLLSVVNNELRSNALEGINKIGVNLDIVAMSCMFHISDIAIDRCVQKLKTELVLAGFSAEVVNKKTLKISWRG